MINIGEILLLLVPLVLPMGLGTIFRSIKLFNNAESDALRKFVVRVSIPFLILKNMYNADMASLGQFLPLVTAYFLLTLLYTVSARFLSPLIPGTPVQQNTLAFSIMMGNYAFLGWGVVHSFFGEPALVRAVLFTTFAWPSFLFCGFWLIHQREKEREKKGEISFWMLLVKNASVPLLSVAVGLGLNVLKIKIPGAIWVQVENFAAFTIPMILFTIGLNFSFRMPVSKLKLILVSSVSRLVGGFCLGLIVVLILNVLLPIDLVSRKVILIQSVMPTATFSFFFTGYIEMDNELLSGIIGFSTLLSLLTLPLWYIFVEYLL